MWRSDIAARPGNPRHTISISVFNYCMQTNVISLVAASSIYWYFCRHFMDKIRKKSKKWVVEKSFKWWTKTRNNVSAQVSPSVCCPCTLFRKGRIHSWHTRPGHMTLACVYVAVGLARLVNGDLRRRQRKRRSLKKWTRVLSIFITFITTGLLCQLQYPSSEKRENFVLACLLPP